MEVRQLEIFRALASELNFTRTAERVNTVQSNVTTQIKALEQELGSRLFDRLAKSVILTDAGHRFLPYAESALCAMDEGQRVLKTGSTPAGLLRIGASESILTYRLPKVLGRFQKKFPRVELQFRPYWTPVIVSELEEGRLDIAISMFDEMEWPQLRSLRLHMEKILLVGQPHHPLMRKKAVYPEDFAGQDLLLTETGCSYRLKFDRILAAAGAKPGGRTEFTSVEAIKQRIISGMGFGVLPEMALKREMKSKQLAPLRWKGATLDTPIQVLWHKDKWLSPNIAAFLDVLKGLGRSRFRNSSSRCLYTETTRVGLVSAPCHLSWDTCARFGGQK